jgi:hypothetical protein
VTLERESLIGRLAGLHRLLFKTSMAANSTGQLLAGFMFTQAHFTRLGQVTPRALHTAAGLATHLTIKFNQA